MTTFGLDISHHQTGLSIPKATQSGRIEFVVAKITEGMGWKDDQFASFQRQAEESGVLFAGYHFLRSDSTGYAQAKNVLESIGDPSIPVIIDIERVGPGANPTVGTARDFSSALRDLGGHVSNLLYLPHWYWTALGAPHVAGWDIWQSAYGTNDGTYAGDDSKYWNADRTFIPKVLQYTSNGRVDGYSGPVDLNAFRGTRKELADTGWFKDYRREEEPEVTKEEIQEAVRSTPIEIDADGNTRSLQRVLRVLFNRSDDYNGPSSKEIAKAVSAVVPSGAGVTQDQIEQAVANVLREGTDAN